MFCAKNIQSCAELHIRYVPVTASRNCPPWVKTYMRFVFERAGEVVVLISMFTCIWSPSPRLLPMPTVCVCYSFVAFVYPKSSKAHYFKRAQWSPGVPCEASGNHVASHWNWNRQTTTNICTCTRDVGCSCSSMFMLDLTCFWLVYVHVLWLLRAWNVVQHALWKLAHIALVGPRMEDERFTRFKVRM